MNSKKIALVTGATGFVGKHLCKRLVNDEWDVHVICRPTSNISILNNFIDGHVTYHYYDGENDDIIKIIQNAKPTVVFHLASLFLSQHTFKDILPLIKSNIVFSTHLVDAMIQNDIYNLVNTGTSWQHYNNEDYNPVCLYAATKQAFEDILKYYQEAKGLNVITLKLFDTFGPEDSRQKIFNLFKKAAQSQDTIIMSLGEQYLDFVYIDDVVDAFMLAAQYVRDRQYLGEYAVSSGKRITLRSLAEIFEKVTNAKLNIVWGGRRYREREVMYPWSKGKLLPRWQPQIGLEDGILRSIQR